MEEDEWLSGSVDFKINFYGAQRGVAAGRRSRGHFTHFYSFTRHCATSLNKKGMLYGAGLMPRVKGPYCGEPEIRYNPRRF